MYGFLDTIESKMRLTSVSALAVMFVIALIRPASAQQDQEMIKALVEGMRYNESLIRDAHGVYVYESWSNRKFVEKMRGTPVEMEGDWIKEDHTVRFAYKGRLFLRDERIEDIEPMVPERLQPIRPARNVKAYDGNIRTKLCLSHNGLSDDAVIESQTPPNASEIFEETPWGYARWMFGVNLPDVLDKSVVPDHLKNFQCRLRSDKIEDSEIFVIEFVIGDHVIYTLWIDPSEGYSVRRHEMYELTGQLQALIEMDYKRYRDDIWYPDQIKWKRYYYEGAKQKIAGQMYMRVKTVTFNSDIPDGFFKVYFPPGVNIIDKVTVPGKRTQRVQGMPITSYREIFGHTRRARRIAGKAESGKLIEPGDILTLESGDVHLLMDEHLINDGTLNYCGPISMVAVLAYFGHGATVREMAEAAKMDFRGTSMLGLTLAAKSRGMIAVGVKISVKKLSELEVPAIVLVMKQHFLVVLPFPGDKLLIVDPPINPYLVKPETFKHYRWDGRTLIVAPTEKDLPDFIRRSIR